VEWRREAPSHPLAIAHRAANEPQLLKAAEAAGVDLVEADIWPYRGRLEVRHLKTMGPVPLLWDRWKLTRGWTRRLVLDELLESGAGPQLMLDLKGRNTEASRVILASVREALPGQTFTVCSRIWSLLGAFAEAPGVNVVHSVGSAGQLGSVWKRLEEFPGSGISIHQRLLTPDVVARLLEKVPVVMTWPINDEERMWELIEWGVNGIISDRLEVLEALLARR
jgi:glycerophosphoryl diester phosphodiesterase